VRIFPSTRVRLAAVFFSLTREVDCFPQITVAVSEGRIELALWRGYFTTWIILASRDSRGDLGGFSDLFSLKTILASHLQR